MAHITRPLPAILSDVYSICRAPVSELYSVPIYCLLVAYEGFLEMGLREVTSTTSRRVLVHDLDAEYTSHCVNESNEKPTET